MPALPTEAVPTEAADLFTDLAALDPAERARRLAALPDGPLRREVKSLLRADADADRLLRALDALVSPPAPLAPGDRAGPYRVLGEVGRGGMGVVYLAEDERLGRRVALKVPAPRLVGSAEARARLIEEARAASALDHPHVGTVHDVEEGPGGALCVVLAYYPGETLAARLARGRLASAEAVRLAQQLASALAAAHAHRLVHGDVKPANILLAAEAPGDAPDVKLLDFGVARPAGAAHGDGGACTPAYAAPETLAGEAAGETADLWAFGVVLYEMLAGRRPFGDGGPARPAAHGAPARLPRGTPSALARLVRDLLETDPERRPASAEAVRLRLARLDAARTARRARRHVAVAASVAAALAALAVAFPLQRHLDVARARAAVPEVERLLEAGFVREAHARAEVLARTLGPDPALGRLRALVTDTLVVTSAPSGARVHLARLEPGTRAATFEDAGRTPLRLTRPRADFLVRLHLPGHAPVERVTRSEGPIRLTARARRVHAALPPADRVPPGMVPVPGGPYALAGWGAPTREPVTLAPFFIDAHEVTNRAFYAFVAAGGYRDARFWTVPLVDERGRSIRLAEARARLVDQTGLPGPRGWAGGTYPPGMADLPVTGVTRYEAAAYAAWAGKRLPTLFEWDRAARDGRTAPRGVMMPWGELFGETDVRDRANVEGRGLAQPGAHPFGLSPYGAHDMAGNAAEWVRGPDGPGGPSHLVAGGSWRDPPYLFGRYGAADPFHASDALGFRCAGSPSGAGVPAVAPFPPPPAPPVYRPLPEAAFGPLLAHYAYDARPLAVQTAATREAPDWTLSDLRFEGPDGLAYRAFLYLPRHARPPYQAIVFGPHDGVFLGIDVPWATEYVLGAHIRAGRAVLVVVPPGAVGAPDPGVPYTRDVASVAYRDRQVQLVTAARFGLDVLLARPDIDPERVAFVAISAGAWRLIVPAVEPRFRSAVLIGSLLRTHTMDVRPEANPVHFAPRIRAPLLLINGRHDENAPVETEVRPLLALLPPHARAVFVEGGHAPSPEARVPLVEAWLNETLGPVGAGG